MRDRIARLFVVLSLSLVGLAMAQSANATLPTGWLDSDVGTVGIAGSASYSNGTFTVSGAGSGLFNTSDGLNFAYQAISGDCTIVARLVTSGTSSDPQVGVMIRETLDADSAEASVVYNDRGQPSYFYFFDRTSTGASPDFVNSPSKENLAYWIKLVRSGNNFSAYTSLNGLSWSQLGTTQLLTMGQNAYVGLSVDSRATSVLATATFDNVSITTLAITPPSITSVSATTGNSGTQVVLTGSGFGTTQTSSVALLNGTTLTVNSWADTSIQVTLPTGVTSGPLSVAIAPTMNASNPILFEVMANPLPTGWLNQDVGLTGVIGTATYSNNQFTVVAAGAGIDNGNDTTTDGFHFVYQLLSGDGTIIARIASVTGPGSQAGVMIRETLASNATNDFLWYYPGTPNQIIDTDRLNPGASTSSVSNNVQNLNAPCWLKLVRQGNFISPYTSSDGVNWNSMATPLPFTMQSNVYIGLGVTDRSLSSTTTAVFDNISITSASTAAPTINSLSASTGVAGTQINITGTSFGSSQGSSQVYLNGTPASVNSWAAGAITITVPTGATSGPLVVSVAPAMDDSNAVSFTVTSQPLLTGWLDSDVGIVGLRGNATYNGGTFTVNGAGNSIGGTADGFHFVYQPITTDGTIIARLTALSSNYAQAGVMIRETLTATSADFFPYAEYVPSNGYYNYLDYRIGANASTSQQGGQVITLPIWFKAVRAANVFTAYTSTDGMIWTQYGTPQTIATAQTVYMGFGVSSGNTNLLAAATFDNVALSGGASNPNPVVTSLNPTSGVTGSTVQIVGSGFGSTQGTSPASVVLFNGTAATVNSWSDGLISVVVPDNAATGPVSVVVGNITGSGPPFTVSFKAQLTDSLGNVSNYTSQVIGSRWSLLNFQGSGCSTCSNRTNHQYTYDGNANPLFVTDALGNMSKKSYDTSKNLAALTVPIDANTAATTTYTYNGMGEVLTATDALGQTTTNTYDTHGNLLTTQTPSPDGSTAGSITHFTYNTLGQLVTITDPLNNVTTLTYTPVGLIYTVKDAQNNVTTYGYDSRGNRTSVIDALTNQTTFTYDTGNRLTKITYPDTTTVQIGYDYRGRRTSVTDQNNKTTTYAYDDADRLTTVTDAATNLTTYGYDTESNLTSIKDANNNTTTFTYDAYGRVTKTTFPSGLYETYTYDANNNLVTKTDRKNQTITYTYDQMNRLTQKTYPDSTGVGYTYDLASRLTQVLDPTGTYAFTFDNMGRLHTTSTDYTFLSRSLNTSYTYDKASNRTAFTDPESGSTSYAYDTLNRLSTLTPPSAFSTGSFSFSYDSLNRRTQMTRPNNVTTSFTYDNLSHLLTVLHKLSGSTIDGAAYTLDNAGNRTAKTDQRTAVATSYGYDNIYQLLSATQGATATESYTYDPVGNRLSDLTTSGWSNNTSNELTSRPGVSYTFDNNGNQLTKVDSTGTTSYTWDFENRLTSVTLPGTGGAVQFSYDPFGRRIKKSSSAGTSVFAYDNQNLIEETNASGAVVARYAQGEDIDEPLAMLRSSTTSYYQSDGLGSVTTLSTGAGSLAQTYVYDAFGKQTSSSGSLVNPFQYTGREFDSETSLYFYRARFYDPSMGRFLSEDPLEFAGGRNFYTYTRNDPVSLFDPSGLTPTQGNVVAPLLPGDNAGVVADLDDPRLKALFPSGPDSPWPKGIRHYGESEQCVSFTKFFTGLPCSGCWRAGPKVVGNNVPAGTAIATFDDQGLYPNGPHGNNSGIYAGPASSPPNSIIILDQWPGHNASARTITPKGATPSDQSGAYSLITVPYGTKSKCGKCGNW